MREHGIDVTRLERRSFRWLSGQDDDSRRRLRVLRQRAIDRFTRRQQLTREWISFEQIAKESAEVSGQSKAEIYSLLRTSMLAGEFEQNGLSTLLYLNDSYPATLFPASTAKAIAATRRWLEEAMAVTGYDDVSYLSSCWMAGKACKQWIKQNRLIWPAAFDCISIDHPRDEHTDSINQVTVSNQPVPDLYAAVAKLIDSGSNPPKTLNWTSFCDRVRDACCAWTDKKCGNYMHGFSNKSIERAVKADRARVKPEARKRMDK